MAKVDKETHRIYPDDDPYLHTEEAKQREFSDRYNSSVLIFDAGRSEIAEKMGFKTPGLYAIKVR
ncbi:MAG: transcription elongation factor Spt4 [Candidatus Micrarchaeota archaeon]